MAEIITAKDAFPSTVSHEVIQKDTHVAMVIVRGDL